MPRLRRGGFMPPPILPSGMPSPDLANNVFYIFNKGNPNSRMAMWGTAAREMGVRVDGKLLPDQKWVLRPSANAPGYFVIENYSRTGYCLSVWGDGGYDVGVRPVSETLDHGHLWMFTEQSDGSYILSCKLTPKARLADSDARFVNYDGPYYEDQKWRLMQESAAEEEEVQAEKEKFEAKVQEEPYAKVDAEIAKLNAADESAAVVPAIASTKAAMKEGDAREASGPHFVAQKVNNKIICDRFLTLEAAKAAYDQLGTVYAKCIVGQAKCTPKEQSGSSPDIELAVKAAQEEASISKVSSSKHVWVQGPHYVAYQIGTKITCDVYPSFEGAQKAYSALGTKYAKCIVSQTGGGVKEEHGASTNVDLIVKAAQGMAATAEKSQPQWAPGAHYVSYTVGLKVVCEYYPSFQAAKTAYDELGSKKSKCIVTQTGGAVRETHGNQKDVELNVKAAQGEAENAEPLWWSPGIHYVAHDVSGETVIDRYPTFERAKTAYDNLGMLYAKCIVAQTGGSITEEYGSLQDIEKISKSAQERAAKEEASGRMRHYVAHKVENEITCDHFPSFEAAKARYEDLGLAYAKCIVSEVEGGVREKHGRSPDVDLSVKVAQREAALAKLSPGIELRVKTAQENAKKATATGPTIPDPHGEQCLWAPGPHFLAQKVGEKIMCVCYPTFEAAKTASDKLGSSNAKCIVTQTDSSVKEEYGNPLDLEMIVRTAQQEAHKAEGLLPQWQPGPHLTAYVSGDTVRCNRYPTFGEAKVAYDELGVRYAKCLVTQTGGAIREVNGESSQAQQSVKTAQAEAAKAEASASQWSAGPHYVAQNIQGEILCETHPTFESAKTSFDQLGTRYSKCIVSQANSDVIEKHGSLLDIDLCVAVAQEQAAAAAVSSPHFVAHHANGQVEIVWHADLDISKKSYEALGLRYAKCIVTVADGDVVEKYGSSPYIEMCVQGAQESAGEEKEAEVKRARLDTTAKIQDEADAKADADEARKKATDAEIAAVTATAAAKAAADAAVAVKKREAESKERARLEAIARQDAENLAQNAKIEAEAAAKEAMDIEQKLAADREYQLKVQSLALARKARKESKLRAQSTALDTVAAVKSEARAKKAWNEDATILANANAAVAVKQREAKVATTAEKAALRWRLDAEGTLLVLREDREMTMALKESSRNENSMTLARARFIVRRSRLALAIVLGAFLGSWRVSFVVALLCYFVVGFLTPGIAASVLFEFDSAEVEVAWGLQSDGLLLPFQIFVLTYLLMYGIGGDEIIVVQQELAQE